MKNKEVTSNVQELEDELPETISIVWSYEDVLYQADEINRDITSKQAKEILQKLKHNHDCNYGITWEIMDEAIKNTADEQ